MAKSDADENEMIEALEMLTDYDVVRSEKDWRYMGDQAQLKNSPSAISQKNESEKEPDEDDDSDNEGKMKGAHP